MLDLSLLLLLAQSPAPAPQAETRSQPPIVVTGMPERVDDRAVEQPYSETERVPLGSRIARRVDARPFNTVASETGLAGLTPGPENNFDATGAATPRFAGRPVIECRAGHRQVTERTACILFRVRRAIERQEYQVAAAAIEPLLANRSLSGIDRYYVASFNLQLAEATDDDVRREAALTAMVENGRMPAADRTTAIRILAQMAARRGDNAAAAARLERLVAEMPDEPRNHADLAWLYARSGREAEALPRMAQAVDLARRSGTPVPQAWIDFLNADP